MPIPNLKNQPSLKDKQQQMLKPLLLIPLTKKMSTFGTLLEKFNTVKFSHPFQKPL
jgi:hypothetical protein